MAVDRQLPQEYAPSLPPRLYCTTNQTVRDDGQAAQSCANEDAVSVAIHSAISFRLACAAFSSPVCAPAIIVETLVIDVGTVTVERRR